LNGEAERMRAEDRCAISSPRSSNAKGGTSGPVLILSLVHPDLLPSLYSVADVLRQHGSEVHVITFSSPTEAAPQVWDGVQIHECGRINGDFRNRRAARRVFRRRLEHWMRVHNPRAILVACPFAYLEALRIRARDTPIVFLFYEMYDASLGNFRESPATALRNWRTLRLLRRAELICVPSPERAGWLMARARLRRLPVAVLNSPSATLSTVAGDVHAPQKPTSGN
jgi:hypothetical protein